MNVQLNAAEIALLLELLNNVDQRVQYSDVQNEISSLINQLGGAA